jgi:hypothetical protein
MSPATFDLLRSLWRHDWEAMKRGSYTAPLPHPKMFVGHSVNPTKVGAKMVATKLARKARKLAEGAAVVVLVCATGVVW